ASRTYPAASGRETLLRRASREEVSVTTIGVGHDVNSDELKRYEVTGGSYLYSPTPDALRALFAKTATTLSREVYIEYRTNDRDLDGTRRSLSVKLAIQNHEIVSVNGAYVAPGFLPVVRGDHAPFFAAAAGLFFAPPLASLLGAF